jgi:anhydro-N-acetylmuramic acid kinase
MGEYTIGLMSGTSLDALDAVLVDFSNPAPMLIASHSHAIPDELRRELAALTQPGENEITRLGEADLAVAELSAEAVTQLLKEAGVSAQQIMAIGSHGQTIRHCPEEGCFGFTLQIGDPNTIAQRTGITTVADFRRRDLAAGGQGAPLVPAFHAAVFRRPDMNRVMINIGGIANITRLPADTSQPITGFDTGPGNGLLDAWAGRHLQQAMDKDGRWAASGQVSESLLERCLNDDYFHRPPPKSTGKEYFNLGWVEGKCEDSLPPEDIQATLCELTAVSIAEAVDSGSGKDEEVLICGGGVHNATLMARLRHHLAPRSVANTGEAGVPPDWVEAMAFAWLARETLAGRPGNLPSVTGASQPVILGGIYPANP